MARQKNTVPPEKVLQRRSPLNMKASPELRAQIEEAARENGLSLTQEVERRLMASFQAESAAGGQRTAAFIKLLVGTIADIEAETGQSWHEDYLTWEAVRQAVPELIRRKRPTPPNADEIVAAIEEESGLSTLDKLQRLGGGASRLSVALRPLEQLEEQAEALAANATKREQG